MSNASLIAIVDDDRFVRQSLERLLSSLGYHTGTFGSAAEYLESTRQAQIACLIADMQMPGMSGLDLYLRLLKSGRDIPTILITAYPDEAVRIEALRSGVSGYLAKPFREAELIASVQSALAVRRGGEEGSS